MVTLKTHFYSIVIARIIFRLITKLNQVSNNGCQHISNGNYMMFWRLP